MTQVSPFDVTLEYPTAVNDVAMANYIDWMRSCWYVTMMSNPALSVSAGFTSTGLPGGIQIVGRHRADWSVLQLGHAFEQATRARKATATSDSQLTRPRQHALTEVAAVD